MANVFIAVPHYDQLAPQALEGLILASQQHRYSINTEGGSLLALIFNRLWVRALNRRKDGITHFAMHHADVEAPAGWVDTLLEEKDRVGADIVSCVLPIKDNRGLTSTAYQDPETSKIRRLTVKEVLSLPRSFDRLPDEARFQTSSTAPSRCTLLVNTGLWLCDFTRPWVEEACFHILDSITCDEDGIFQARAIPEDWNFSNWAARKGLRVFATRCLKVHHHGRAAYANHHDWGRFDSDPGDKPVL
jgi:hypothetical protein